MLILLKAIVFLVLLFQFSTAGAAEPAKVEYVPDTEMAIPLMEGVAVNWVLLDNPSLSSKRVKNFIFDVNREGKPWFGWDNDLIINPLNRTLFKVDVPYQDFCQLDNGQLLVCTTTDLGILLKPGEPSKSGDKVPVAEFQAVIKLPHKNFRIFPGGNNTIYLAGRNTNKGESEVYLMSAKKGKGSMEKIFTTKKRISAVCGNGDETYVAVGKLILRLVPGKDEIQGVFLHPREKITGLDYSPKSGLFYTTESAIGFVSDDNRFEFMKSPDTQIRLRDESLFVLLGKTYGVLRIDGINKFKSLKVRLLKQTMARRHMIRGQAAVEMAKTPADYEHAIREYEQAAKFAPDWPEIYYNLGVVQKEAGKYQEAIGNLKKYLALAPDATDADAVRDLIYKIEFLKERGWSKEDLVGTWVGPKEVGNLTISMKKQGELLPRSYSYQKGEFVVKPNWPSSRVHIHSAKFDGKQLIISLSHFHGNEMTGYTPIRDEYYDLTMVSGGRMTGTVKITVEKGRKTITGEWLRR